MDTIAQQTEKLKDVRIAWLKRKENHGILTRVAEQTGTSPGFVRIVFHGGSGSKHNKVEDALARAGAPGFAKETTDVS
jgi:hypothetical protein